MEEMSIVAGECGRSDDCEVDSMTAASRAWIGYSGPMLLFGLFTAAEGLIPRTLYVPAYAIKIAAVAASLVFWKRTLRDIQPSWSVLAPSVLIGVGVFVAWVGIDAIVPYPHLGERIGFDPFSLQSSAARLAFLALRFCGLVLVVPVMEELFWRSFLLRWATNADFLPVPMGTFSFSAFGLMVAASAVAHTEWLVAALTSVVFALWLRRTRSLFAAVVAHAAANGALGVYIIRAHEWKYW
jgi:CAAX prenyl protease-like protein